MKKSEVRSPKLNGTNGTSVSHWSHWSHWSHLTSDFGLRPSSHAPRSTLHAPRLTPAFTLIELILVMAILTMAVSVTAPALSHFFRGRTLDSEARRLLALTHDAQSRAVSEGVPMDLWINTAEGKFGLQVEPSYENEDPKAVELDLDSGLEVEIVSGAPTNSASALNLGQPVSVASVPRVVLARPNLPTLRFLPDGSIDEASPRSVRLTDRDGTSLWLAQTRDHLAYEIRETDK